MVLSLKRWRDRPPALADFLTWGLMIEPSVVVNKDGAFMCVVRYRGHDLESRTPGEVMGLRTAANNALRRLGSSWALHFEARRVEVADYPDSEFPDPITHTLDEERRRTFGAQDSHYETQHFLTFTYLPPSDRVASLRGLLIEGEPDKGGADYAAELRQYKATVETTLDLLAQTLLHVELLADGELLTYLHSTVTDHPIELQLPEVPMHLDCLLANARFIGGLAPRLGGQHLATVGVVSWPNDTTPAMLDRLHSLGIPYRWVARWMPYSRADAQKKVGRIRQLWFGKRKGMGTLIKEALTKQESAEVDNDAVAKYEDADVAHTGLSEDLYSYGHFTLTITTQGDTAELAASRARQVRQVVDGLGLVSVVESVNAVDAWLGSLPGHVYADARRPLLSSLNLCDLMPISSVWAGDAECRHLRGPALLTAAARGSTPFRLNLWHGDVGHTMVLGPTGAGKSTLLGTLAAQFRRYPGAQVYFFDVGKSSRALTKAVGGEFHDLGSDGGMDFQPLRAVDQASERVWARDWLVELCRLASLQPDTAQTNAISDALESLSQMKTPQRTLSVLRGLIQDREVKEALSMYTASGVFGTLLDADSDTLSYADWQAFEMEEMMGSPGQLTPVLLYIFHVLERRFADEEVSGAPTLLVLDEAWSFLDNSLFAERIRAWLKTLRKRNVAVIFASQSLADVAASSIATALIESCPTTIYLPNAKALDPSTADIYRQWGLSDAELRVIAEARPKREYYFRSPRGNRLFDMELGEFALNLVGASDKSDQAVMDEAEAKGLSGTEFVEWFTAERVRRLAPSGGD